MNLINIAGRKRVVIEYVGPQIDGGQFAIKRVPGEKVDVEAHIYCDGHDQISALLYYKHEEDGEWQVANMEECVNDEWSAAFRVEKLGRYVYTVQAWIDHFKTWQQDIFKKYEAGQALTVDLQIGAELLKDVVKRAEGEDKDRLSEALELLEHVRDIDETVLSVTDEKLSEIAQKYPPRNHRVKYDRELKVLVDQPKALFSSWYELFPRSCGEGTEHGTFEDCEKMLGDIAELGFDTVYLPPIHPIGLTHRKGRNNSLVCSEDDPGSPWAIGAKEGGHKAIHRELGTVKSFERLVKAAKEHGLDVAIDLAFQCSPDHPYVEEHPEWFKWRPDGSVQFAENPPKKYEDILPINFETQQWRDLWEELKSVILFWVEKGVRVIRVDNPHTKPFAFWEWVIAEVRKEHPDVVFLAEAFTRPKIMKRLAKIGFDQSYTYFTWRNTRYELQEYVNELTKTDVAEYMRPNFWPNTPDILPEHLQFGGRAAFIARVILAGTLSSNYGLYGPAYELCVSEAVPGKEEYLHSEKYEIKDWDRERSGNLRAVIRRLNRIRRENRSLQQTRNIEFLPTENEAVVCYVKTDEDVENITVTMVNLDPHFKQSTWIHLPIDELGLSHDQPYLMHDLLSDDKYIWHGERNYIELDPHVMPAHILRVRKRLKRETDFDYFM
ncbi:Alpha-1,4-glucan:maltose-1-phosphate maltosyltransferase 1 [Anaerohalosphaera lusitana]|uniref:Alpha-1,4-glucan:maltose-1-phosphate maltosyltransferase n=1 Tax=Anaerohalosphaera lusitana TaxID=1936003 RepID=A0A1U9NKI9_9BACT|nr:alpha-1,4-glucan--maltose-1-phosphate maltosyltransferase [Anaerohalosphaera lusitana]AQT68453.1 Alpha-1,4-glucan:maltose-1-phosphate maltosyltransferase 1 [Anaerohalosphaera lusitana]